MAQIINTQYTEITCT